ncbi:hypothetical protein PRZ48_003373 [Zasmidium cellare]|uniref:Uncharacterized protein n=1 Tax=Zasmidium cellare TaxID=395010 RepID=A0ABR0EWE7_ZASCE|nr:hypothetical protein PRZ48_003373 [Zasmidium cellare]
MEEYLSRPSVRLVALSVAVISSRHLFEDGFHFPTFLSLAHITISLACKALVRSRKETQQPDDFQQHSLASYAWLGVYTASTTGALICGYQSLLHVKNTTLWMMILGLHWGSLLPENARSFLERSLSVWFVEMLRYTTFATCVALLLLQDLSMTNKFEYLTLGAAGCVVIARRSFEEVETVKFGDLDAHSIALAVSLVPIAVAMGPNEWKNSGNFTFFGHLGMLLLNLPAGAAVICGGVARSSAEEDNEQRDMLKHPEVIRLCLSVGLTAEVALDNLLFQLRPTTTTIGQWVAFIVALLVTMDIEILLMEGKLVDIPWIRRLRPDTASRIRLPTEDREEEDEIVDGAGRGERDEPDETTSYRAWTPLAFQTTLNALVWLLVVHALLTHRRFDTAYSQNTSVSSSLDIVIARYEEPIDTVANAVDSILQIPKVAAMNSTVLIYNKGSEIDVSSRFPLASKVLVTPKENVGREGETFLSHLLNDSYSFADHTLFMQAEPHELDELVARIRQYFVEDTGFLSLSYTGSFCSVCDRCWDISGWHEGAIVEDLYEQMNSDEQCRGISLTYRAQLIASRKRIERMNRSGLEQIKERLLGNESFGFSLERLWGMVFGCPSIPSSCPSLWSGQMGAFAPDGMNKFAVITCRCVSEHEKPKLEVKLNTMVGYKSIKDIKPNCKSGLLRK